MLNQLILLRKLILFKTRGDFLNRSNYIAYFLNSLRQID